MYVECACLLPYIIIINVCTVCIVVHSVISVQCCYYQWSFLKTGTLRILANQAEIGVWVQAPGALLLESEGMTPRKKF